MRKPCPADLFDPGSLCRTPSGGIMTTVSFVLREGEETVSVEQNKIVAERFFEEVFNNKKTESVDELVAGDVVDHNRIIFAQPEGPGGVAEGIPAKEYRFEDYADRTLSASLRGHLERHRFFSGKDRGINQSGIQRYKGNAEEGGRNSAVEAREHPDLSPAGSAALPTGPGSPYRPGVAGERIA
jgi:hypothetical protein